MLNVDPVKPASPGQTLERAEGATNFKGEAAPVGMCVSNRPEAMAAAAQGLQPQPKRKAEAAAEGADSPSKRHSREAIGAAGFAHASAVMHGITEAAGPGATGAANTEAAPSTHSAAAQQLGSRLPAAGMHGNPGSAGPGGPTAVRGREPRRCKARGHTGPQMLRTGSACIARQRRSRSAARLIRQCVKLQGLLAWGRSVSQISGLRRPRAACMKAQGLRSRGDPRQ